MARSDFTWTSYATGIASSISIKLFIVGAAITIISNIVEDSFASDSNPIGVCDYNEGNLEGESICVNAIYNSGFSILIAVVLFIIDLIIPFFSPLVIQVASGVALCCSVLFTLYWMISCRLVANLYIRYCDDDEHVCTREVSRFLIIPIMSFLSMLAWVINGMISFIRVVVKK